MVAGPEPKDDGWMTSEVQRRKAAAVVVMAKAMWKKKESHCSDTMLEILEDLYCIS